MNQLYPIIRRARRPLYPPDYVVPATPVIPPAVEEVPLVFPVEVAVVADSQSLSLQAESQSLLTSAATKGVKRGGRKRSTANAQLSTDANAPE